MAAATLSFSSPHEHDERRASSIDVSRCGSCGADVTYDIASRVAEDAQRRISELEAQVRILTGKATAAVDKLADYEDQLHRLKSATTPNSLNPQHSPPSPSSSAIRSTSGPPALSSAGTDYPSISSTLDPSPALVPLNTSAAPRPNIQTRLTSLLPSSSLRRKTPQPSRFSTQSQSSPPPPDPTTPTAAEEIEELSVALFTEANEMVAAERKARKKLEDRIEVLERRDREKKDRLTTLEGRLGRIERVRGLLTAGAPEES